MLAHVRRDEGAAFPDEVDINTNPKMGCTWIQCGAQAAVETPGNNEKRCVAGSLSPKCRWVKTRVRVSCGRLADWP